MPSTQLPEVPNSLSNLKPYLKLAAMHDERDLVVAYWFRLEAIQQGLRISTKSMEETQFFMKLMQWLEETKKENHDNEAITNDVVAQAHLENWALKLFLYADENDRAGNFNKNVIQAFYTSSMIYQLIKTFGPLNEEAERNMKYAKWKSVYINNCLKKGETPVSGPLDTEDNEEKEDNEDSNVASTSKNLDIVFPSVPSSSSDKTTNDPKNNTSTPVTPNPPHNPAPTPTSDNSKGSADWSSPKVKAAGGVELNIEQMERAKKLIKWAGSALNWEDVPTAITNLQQALNLLTTGREDA